MIEKRFMVQGKRLDNGEIIIGFPIFIDSESVDICTNGSSSTYDTGKRVERGYCYRIDVSTLEPIPVKVESSSYAGSTNYSCPNCNGIFLQPKKKQRYCEDCGQHLDWDI